MSRRGENIYKRRDGRWEGRYISARRPDGRAVYKSLYACSYQEVRARLERAKAANTRQPEECCRLTVGALSLQWLESVRSTVKESTYARYSSLVRCHLIPALGSVRADRLTANLLSGFVNQKLGGEHAEKKGGLAPKTVQDIVIVLKAVLKRAGLEYELPNCAAGLKLPKAEKPEIRVLSDADIPVLEAALRKEGGNGSAGILLCLYTGLRLGEVCAARWSDIDWSENVLHVRRTVIRLPRREGSDGPKTRLTVTTPKTRNAERLVPLPAGLAATLRELSDRQDKDAYIATGKAGRLMDPRTYQYRFHRILEELGIDPVNFHALRHTYATQCIRRGVDVKTLSETLGHSTVQMTLDRYVHLSIEARKKQLEGLDFSSI